MKKGFTLIELLVVVLIIGILSAVALPKYKKSVERARAAEAWTTAKSFIDAQKVYYMSNGYWATDFDDLDIEMPEMKNWDLTISAVTNIQGQPNLWITLTGKNLMNGFRLSYELSPNGQVIVKGDFSKAHLYPCKLEMSAMAPIAIYNKIPRLKAGNFCLLV